MLSERPTEEEASRVKPPSSSPSVKLIGLLLGLMLAVVGCTGDDEPAAKPSKRPTTPSPSATVPASVPMKVVVTRVHGRLPVKSRPALEANVRKTLSAYLDAAFLKGDYPRSDFTDSFGAFTRGAGRDARRDQGLLTNKNFGPTTTSVRAVRRTAYLSVLAPYKVAAGITARVDLVFVVDRGDRPAQNVRMGGRLLLTRASGGGWSIFGYDLHRSDKPRSAS